MKVKVMCRKFECRQRIDYKTQTGTSCEKPVDNECKCQILLLIYPYSSPALPSH